MTHGAAKLCRYGMVVIHGLSAGLIVIVCVCAIVWLWMERCEEQLPKDESSQRQTNALIVASKNSLSTNTLSQANVSVKAATKRKSLARTYIDDQGIERYVGGCRVPKKNPRIVVFPDRRAVKWKYACEDTISTLIEIEPGEMIVGDDVTYGERFVKDFKESLKEEIKIEPDDDWYQRHLKEGVIDAKKQLVAAMNRGEDIGKILTDMRKELRRLYENREKVIKQMRELIQKNKDYTEQDIEDLSKAANEILKDAGCKPIKYSKQMVKQIIRRNQKRKGVTK